MQSATGTLAAQSLGYEGLKDYEDEGDNRTCSKLHTHRVAYTNRPVIVTCFHICIVHVM